MREVVEQLRFGVRSLALNFASTFNYLIGRGKVNKAALVLKIVNTYQRATILKLRSRGVSLLGIVKVLFAKSFTSM